MNTEKLCIEMGPDEERSIALAVLKNKVRENIEKYKQRWLKLKENNQIDRELGNIQKATGITAEMLRIFSAIILEPYAPEIFGKPERKLSDYQMGYISYVVLLSYVKREGLRVLPENQERRTLGNIAASAGIKIERLKIFGNRFLKAVADQAYPVPFDCGFSAKMYGKIKE